jgi:predicted nucleic acid-binding protein
MGSVVLDSGVIIGLFSSADPHHDWATAQIEEALIQRDSLIISTVTVAEVLVPPARTGDAEKVLADLHSLRANVAEVSQAVALRAARLRASHASLRLPRDSPRTRRRISAHD